MKIYKFIKTSILFICTLSISTHCLSQSTDSDQTINKFEYYFASGYSNFIRTSFVRTPSGILKGSYAYGLGIRYRGKSKKLIRSTIGLSYSILSQKRIHRIANGFISNGKEINRFHYLSIPYQLVFNVKSWRGGLQLSLGSPVLEVEINRDANASGRLGPRDRNSLGTNISTNWGFDVGAFVGKTIHLPNEDYFFIEGQFTGFNYIQPNRSNDSFRLKGTFPYWIVLKIGKGF